MYLTHCLMMLWKKSGWFGKDKSRTGSWHWKQEKETEDNVARGNRAKLKDGKTVLLIS